MKWQYKKKNLNRMRLNHQLLNKATAIKNRIGTKKKLSQDFKNIVFVLHEEHQFTFAEIQLLLLEEENIEITISALSKQVRVAKKKNNKVNTNLEEQKKVIKPDKLIKNQEKSLLVKNDDNNREKQAAIFNEENSSQHGIVKITTKEQDETIAYLLDKKKREGNLSPSELYEFGKLTN